MPILADFRLREFCAQVGSDPMLTQAAGGNVSVKVGDQLWVKASGTWLANALTQDIFVSVDLPALHDQIQQRNFDSAPVVLGSSRLRPSIETVMHACLPHRYVVHLHAIQPLSILVRDNPEPELECALEGASFNWRLLQYFKPGGPLAREIVAAVRPGEHVECLLLRNHGIIFGAESLDRVMEMIHEVHERLEDASRIMTAPDESESHLEPGVTGWHSPQDRSLHSLALNPVMVCQLKNSWALFPDHVVFLGDEPAIVSSTASLDHLPAETQVAFVAGVGVAVREGHKVGLEEQLRAYLDVIMRQRPSQLLSTLSEEQVAELLNWDAERYRVALQDGSRRL